MTKKNIVIIASVAAILVVGGVILIFTLVGGEKEEKDTNKNTNANVVSTKSESAFSFRDAVLIFPDGAASSSGTVDISVVPKSQAPEANEGEEIIGDVYDVKTTASLKSDKTAFLSLKYDPTQMPKGYTGDETTNETLMYLGHYNGTKWKEVPGAIVDKNTKTVYAPVTEFSYFTLIVNPLAELIKVDIIEPIDRFADLPLDIKQDLDPVYAQSDIKSGLDWTVSPRTRIASQTILGANFVNTISGGILAAVEEGEDMVYEWIAEELVKEIGHDVLAAAFNEEAADFAITLYDTATLGSEIYSVGFEGVKNAPMLQAKIAAQILSYTMDYINANTQEAYSDLATLDWWAYLTSNAPLKVTVVGVSGKNKKTGYYDQGLKFYYYNNTDEKWHNYANGVVAMDVNDVEISEGTTTTNANVNTSVNTNVSTNFNTTVNTNTSTGISGCLDIDLSSDYKIYDTYKGTQCSSFLKSFTSSEANWKCSTTMGTWRGVYVKEVDLSENDKVSVKGNLGLYDSAGLFTSTCSGNKGVHYANYVRLTVHENDPRPNLNSSCVAGTDLAWTDCTASENDSDVLGWCGVPKCETEETCNFEISVPSSGKVYFVFVISDAWDYADVDGTLSNLRVCPSSTGLSNTNSSSDTNNYARARDSTRLSDIAQLRAALEMHYVDLLEYPDSLSDLVSDYIKYVPENPTPGGMDYTYFGSASSYTLKYKLEVGSGTVSSGTHTATEYGAY